jgi:hypothetical protein
MSSRAAGDEDGEECSRPRASGHGISDSRINSEHLPVYGSVSSESTGTGGGDGQHPSQWPTEPSAPTGDGDTAKRRHRPDVRHVPSRSHAPV